MKLPIGEIKPNPKNPRVIKDENYKKLLNSIKEFPEMADVREIVVNKDHVILGGNMRFRAMQEAGWTEVPVKIVDWPQEKQNEFIIKDNISGGDWDWNILANEWDAEELGKWGFDEKDLGIHFDTEVEEDEAPEVQEGEPDSKIGEVYQLGRHRLMCGDATKKEDVEKLMDGQKADMVFTDPPYGVSVVKDGMVGADFGVAKKGKYSEVMGDDDGTVAREAVAILLDMADKAIIWGGNYFLEFLPASTGWIIWNKRADSGIKNTFADGEMAWCSFHTPVRIYDQLWNGMIREGEKDKRVHPTQKPIRLLTDVLNNFSEDGNVILDTFGGSGSTIIAAEQTGRTCYMMELDCRYIDVIIKRWENLTGQKAKRIEESK